MGYRVRTLIGLWMLLELAVFVLVAAYIGLGWTILAAIATSALGMLLLGRQGTRSLRDLREQADTRRAPGRALGDAGLVAAGGLLMVLPGFVGDVIGLLCLLPATRAVPRALLTRLLADRLPVALRGPVRVRSRRGGPSGAPGPAGRPVVIDGELGGHPAAPQGTLQVESHRVD